MSNYRSTVTMQVQRQNIWRFFNPLTDIPLIILGISGIAIFVAFDYLAVKLIGICITLLSILALFLMITQRIKEDVPSQISFSTDHEPPSIIRVEQHTTPQGTKRITFDLSSSTLIDDPTTDSISQPNSPFTTEQPNNGLSSSSLTESLKEEVISSDNSATIGSLENTSTDNTQTLATPDVGHIRQTVDIPLTTLSDLSNLATEPRKEFTVLLKQVLKAIANLIDPRLVFYGWVIEDRNEIRIEAFVASTSLPLRQPSFPLKETVIAQIIEDQKPQIVMNIRHDVELDLIPYLEEATGTKCLIGFPIQYNETTIGILVADSTDSRAFDTQTVHVLAQFAYLITALVHGYISKYDFYQAAQFVQQLQRIFPENQLCWSDPTILHQQIQDLCATIHPQLFYCMGEWSSEGWNIIASHPLYPDQYYIQLLDSITAQWINQHQLTTIFNIEAQLEHRVSGIASIVSTTSIPCGVFIVGYPAALSLSEHEQQALRLLASLIQQSSLANNFAQRDLLDLFLLHTLPALWDTTSFRRLVAQELSRSQAFKYRSSLLLARIDYFLSLQQRLSPPQLYAIITHVLNQLIHYCPEYASIGWLGRATFGIWLPNVSIGKARALAEQIREAIAQTVVPGFDPALAVTVSIGIVESRNQRNIEHLFQKAEAMVEQATQQANTVKIYA